MEKRQESTLTRSCVGDAVHLQDEIILEENVADDGEQVDQDESQHGGQHDGAAVAGHTLDHVQQRLLSVHEVKKLQEGGVGSSSLPPSSYYCCGERGEVRRGGKKQSRALGSSSQCGSSLNFQSQMN